MNKLKINQMTENKIGLETGDNQNGLPNESNLASPNDKANVSVESVKLPVMEDDEEEENDQEQGFVTPTRDSGRVQNLNQRSRTRRNF